RETMHRSAEQRFLTFERSYRWFVFLRLTGESRNLRVGHSVRDPYLIPALVVGKGLHLAELQRDLVRGRASNGAYRRGVSIGVERIDHSRRVTKIRNPQFPVLFVDEHTRGIREARAVSFDQTRRSHIALIRSLEY